MITIVPFESCTYCCKACVGHFFCARENMSLEDIIITSYPYVYANEQNKQ